jgi:hypothetical protein
MRDEEFNYQVNRLIKSYGEKSFPAERLVLLHQEVKDFSAEWFKRVVDRLIADSRYAPLLSDFREEIARERERMAYQEKKQHEADAQAFYRGTYQAEDARTICQYILKRVDGKVPDGEFSQFINVLENAATPMKKGA